MTQIYKKSNQIRQINKLLQILWQCENEIIFMNSIVQKISMNQFDTNQIDKHRIDVNVFSIDVWFKNDRVIIYVYMIVAKCTKFDQLKMRMNIIIAIQNIWWKKFRNVIVFVMFRSFLFKKLMINARKKFNVKNDIYVRDAKKNDVCKICCIVSNVDIV